MSKKINVKSVDYTVTATVVAEGENGIEIRSYEDFGLGTKSKRELAKWIRTEFEGNGFDVIAIRDIVAKRVEHVTTFIIDATNAQIVDACLAMGLTVHDVAEVAANAVGEDENDSEQ